MTLTETLARILVALAIYGGSIQTGFAPRYSAGLMEKVARNRGLTIANCMVSSPIYPIGTILLVYGYNTDRAALCRVTDVSADKDRQRHIDTDRVVELSYNDAIRFCGREHLADPPIKCRVLVVHFDNRKDRRNND